MTHPTGLNITSTEISVYVSSQLTCQDIEYGNVDAASLQAALVASETVSTTGTTGNLDDLPRADTKLVVALGLDDGGSLLAGGCVSVGTVSGAMQVNITTEVAATLSVTLVAGTVVGSGSGSGSSDPYQLQAIVTDPNGVALDNRQVWWRVFGAPDTAPLLPAGLGSDAATWEPTEPTCTSAGSARLDPVPPSTIGGFEVEVRVAWGVDPPQYFSEITQFDASLGTTLTPPVEALSMETADHVCERYGSGGSNGIVCLTGGSAVFYDVSVGTGDAALGSNGTSVVPASTIALYGADSGGNHEVFAVGSDCSLSGVFGSVPPPSGTNCAPLGTGADNIMMVPACGSASAKLWIHFPVTGARDRIRVVDLATNASSEIEPIAGLDIGFNSAGCITELSPSGGSATLAQVAVLNYTPPATATSPIQEQNTTHLLTGCAGAGCTIDVPLPVGLTGTGFVQAGTETRLVATTADAEGIELAQYVLLDSGSGHILERSKQPTAAEANLLVSGQFDASSDQDLLWTEEGKRGTTFQVAYPGQPVNGDPLSAISLPLPIHVQELEVGSFSSNGTQVAVYGQGTGSSGTRGLSIIPTGGPAALVTVPAYNGCAP